MSNRKSQFKMWLRNERELSDKTARNYSGAIGGYLSGLAGQDLYGINNSSEFGKVKTQLESREDFTIKNEHGNKMYSNALNRYLEFLK